MKAALQVVEGVSNLEKLRPLQQQLHRLVKVACTCNVLVQKRQGSSDFAHSVLRLALSEQPLVASSAFFAATSSKPISCREAGKSTDQTLPSKKGGWAYSTSSQHSNMHSCTERITAP